MNSERLNANTQMWLYFCSLALLRDGGPRGISELWMGKRPFGPVVQWKRNPRCLFRRAPILVVVVLGL